MDTLIFDGMLVGRMVAALYSVMFHLLLGLVGVSYIQEQFVRRRVEILEDDLRRLLKGRKGR